MSLNEFLLQEFHSKGRLRFDEFMRYCLYHPQYGYYTSGKVRIGREGDYFTSPCVHSLFGWTFAHFTLQQILSDAEGMKLPRKLTFVELGGGEGHFARDFLEYFSRYASDVELRYLIVESSPALQQRQESALQRYAPWITWLSDVEQIPEVTGVLFSNEFFDALPVRRFVIRRGKASEIYVVWKENHWEEDLVIVDTLPEAIQSALSAPFDCQAEFAPDFLPIVNLLCKKLKRGIWTTVDYGEEGNLWEWYPEGTIRGYKKHRMILNPLEMPGEMDITALVPYEWFKKNLQEHGFQNIRIEPQSTFLPRIGIFTVFDEQARVTSGMDKVRLHLGLKTLLNPEGLGETMKVLYAEKWR